MKAHPSSLLPLILLCALSAPGLAQDGGRAAGDLAAALEMTSLPPGRYTCRVAATLSPASERGNTDRAQYRLDIDTAAGSQLWTLLEGAPEFYSFYADSRGIQSSDSSFLPVGIKEGAEFFFVASDSIPGRNGSPASVAEKEGGKLGAFQCRVFEAVYPGSQAEKRRFWIDDKRGIALKVEYCRGDGAEQCAAAIPRFMAVGDKYFPALMAIEAKDRWLMVEGRKTSVRLTLEFSKLEPAPTAPALSAEALKGLGR